MWKIFGKSEIIFCFLKKLVLVWMKKSNLSFDSEETSINIPFQIKILSLGITFPSMPKIQSRFFLYFHHYQSTQMYAFNL